MRRREFLRRAGAGAVGLGMVPAALSCSEAVPSDFRAWTWVHGDRAYDDGEWRRRFGTIRRAGITGVLVGGGDIARLSAAARDEGLSFHRWVWMLHRNGDAWAQENHPECFTVSRNGDSTLDVPPYVGYYRWVCPTRAPVREYLTGITDRIAAEPGVEGVHLDYIRHSDVILPRGLWSTYDLIQDRESPEFDFCYCEECRQAFAAVDGRDPLGIADPTADEAWRRFRWDSVTRLVTEVAEAVHARSKLLTAAVFPTPTIARRLVRQAWDEWPVDMVFPMLYHAFYEEGLPWIGQGVREGVQALAASPVAGDALNAGLYLPDLTPAELAEAVAIVRDAGASGVSFFQMEALSDQHIAALASVLK
jgi:uncharacterized lipoprotein YddW (UPF0748 family)